MKSCVKRCNRNEKWHPVAHSLSDF